MSSALCTSVQNTLLLVSSECRSEVLDGMVKPDDISLLPLSEMQFFSKLNASDSILFAGATYVLLPNHMTGMRGGWTVNVIYPDGSKKTFGEIHALTRLLAVQIAKDDAMDWWMNRRLAQAQVTLG